MSRLVVDSWAVGRTCARARSRARARAGGWVWACSRAHALKQV